MDRRLLSDLECNCQKCQNCQKMPKVNNKTERRADLRYYKKRLHSYFVRAIK